MYVYIVLLGNAFRIYTYRVSILREKIKRLRISNNNTIGRCGKYSPYIHRTYAKFSITQYIILFTIIETNMCGKY